MAEEKINKNDAKIFELAAQEVTLTAVAGEQIVGEDITLKTGGKYVDSDIKIKATKVTIPAADVTGVDTELGYGEETTIPAGMITTPITIKNTTAEGSATGAQDAKITPAITKQDDGTYAFSGEATVGVSVVEGYINEDGVGTIVPGKVTAEGTVAASTIKDAGNAEVTEVTPAIGQQTITVSAGYADEDRTITVKGIEDGPQASFANVATDDVEYKDHEGPVLVSGSYLFINEGYTPSQKISLADLVPNKASGAAAIQAGMLDTVAAYDIDGNLVTGDIQTKGAADVAINTECNAGGVTSTIDVPSGYYADGTSKEINTSNPSIGDEQFDVVYNDENDSYSPQTTATIGASPETQTITIPAGYNPVERVITVEPASAVGAAELYANAEASANIDTVTVQTVTEEDEAKKKVRIKGSGRIDGIATATTTTSGYATAGTTKAENNVANIGEATVEAELDLFCGEYEIG